MAGNYKRRLYNPLMEVMTCLDAMEEDLHEEKVERKENAFQPV